MKIADYFNVPESYVRQVADIIKAEYIAYQLYERLDKFGILKDNIEQALSNTCKLNPYRGIDFNIPELAKKQLYNLLFIRVKNSLLEQNLETNLEQNLEQNLETNLEQNLEQNLETRLPKVFEDIDLIISTNFTKEEEALIYNGDQFLINRLKELVDYYKLEYKRNKRQLIC